MRIVCIGGGPAGLYFGLLMKRRHPGHKITVVERNKPYDTFGWGVVFSDAMMQAMRAADPESAEEIADAFNHWDDIELIFKGARQRTTGHGFIGIGRKHLLNILQRRCEKLGVELVFDRDVEMRSRIPRRRPDHRLRRHQLEHPRALCRGLQARPRRAAQPLHLARHQEAVRRLHLRFPQDRARLVPGAYLQIRPRHRDLHRRDDRGGLSRRMASGELDQQGSIEFCERLFAETLERRQADDQRAPSARLGLAQFQPPDLRRLELFQRQVARRADGRRRPYRAFRDRLGHQARLRRRDRTRQPVRRARPRPRERFPPCWQPTRRSAASTSRASRTRRATRWNGSRWSGAAMPTRWSPSSSSIPC